MTTKSIRVLCVGLGIGTSSSRGRKIVIEKWPKLPCEIIVVITVQLWGHTYPDFFKNSRKVYAFIQILCSHVSCCKRTGFTTFYMISSVNASTSEDRNQTVTREKVWKATGYAAALIFYFCCLHSSWWKFKKCTTGVWHHQQTKTTGWHFYYSWWF